MRIHAGRAADLPPGQGKKVLTPGEAVAVFNIDGVYYACSDACPHAGAPLHLGFLRGTSVSCAWHGWAFDLAAPPHAPPDGIWRYKTVVEAGELFIEWEERRW